MLAKSVFALNKRQRWHSTAHEANSTGPVVLGLYCPSCQNLMKKALHEITAVKAILILFLLSFDS